MFKVFLVIYLAMFYNFCPSVVIKSFKIIVVDLKNKKPFSLYRFFNIFIQDKIKTTTL